jgi:UDP-3-O-[3-hydroxymyristoyl] glucosamine N-acyltransferase
MISLSAQSITESAPELKLLKKGDFQELVGTQPSDAPQSYHLHWLSDPKRLGPVAASSAWIIEEKTLSHPLVQQLLDSSGLWIWSTPSLSLSMAHLLHFFDQRILLHKQGEFRLINSSWIHSTAEIDEQVKILPGSVIGAGVRIGSHSELRSRVTIEDLCHIGSQVLIQSGSVIGSDGFGHVPLKDKNLKIPQIGSVLLEDHVEIGALVAIDRATLGQTRIGAHTKLDNHIHIAHNTQIGARGLLAAGFMCAGSVRIGNDFRCGGDVVVNSHVSICDGVTIGGRSAVTKDITEPGHYVGYPLQPWKEGLRTLQNLTHLTEMRKELAYLKDKAQK